MKTANVFFDRSYGYARAIIALAGGLILVIWPEAVKNSIMIILGALILAVGLVSLIMSYTGKWKKEKVPLLLLNSIVDIAFGLVLIIFPDFFMFFRFRTYTADFRPGRDHQSLPYRQGGARPVASLSGAADYPCAWSDYVFQSGVGQQRSVRHFRGCAFAVLSVGVRVHLRGESNPNQENRNLSFYPLNYGGKRTANV